MPDPDNAEPLDAQLKNLRLGISDLGQQVDTYKTKTAAALGAGVFLLLLAAGAACDLALRMGGTWLTLGVTREAMIWIVGGAGGSAIALLLLGIVRARRRDIDLVARLDRMEHEYAELLERRDAVGRSRG